MNKEEKDFISEEEMGFLIQNSLDEIPDEEVILHVTPWRRAINAVLIGFGLNAVTFNFYGLGYILPAVGMVLSLLGFRMLRQENKWFRTGWVLTFVRTVLMMFTLILNSTIYNQRFYAGPWIPAFNIINLASVIAVMFSFGMGLRAVRLKAHMPPHTGSAMALTIWYVILCVLGFAGVFGWISAILMLISYGFIIYTLYKLSQEMDEAGYLIQTGPVYLNNWQLAAILAGITLTGMAAGYLFFSQLPMDWQEKETACSEEVQTIKEDLLSKGFPSMILDDLTEEEILSCKGAKRVFSDQNVRPANYGHEVQRKEGGVIHITTEYSKKELQISGAAVELPGEREQWRLFQHFQWIIPPEYHGNDSIQLWPADRLDGWGVSSDFTGRMLYDRDDVVYTAPYYALDRYHGTIPSMFWGESNNHDVFAEFSLPRKGENIRGYISYTVDEMQDGCIIDSWLNYTHQLHCLQYPVQTGKEHQLKGLWNWRGNAFITVQDALQFFPREDSVQPLF